MKQETVFKVAPSGLDYALKCKRCLWLSHKGIKLDAFFPPIFNSFDLIQKKFLITQSVKLMSKTFPEGRIMTELNGFIGSSTLKDKKGRSFVISGKTDVVIEFKTLPSNDSHAKVKFPTPPVAINSISPSHEETSPEQLSSLFLKIEKSRGFDPRLSSKTGGWFFCWCVVFSIC